MMMARYFVFFCSTSLLLPNYCMSEFRIVSRLPNGTEYLKLDGKIATVSQRTNPFDVRRMIRFGLAGLSHIMAPSCISWIPVKWSGHVVFPGDGEETTPCAISLRSPSLNSFVDHAIGEIEVGIWRICCFNSSKHRRSWVLETGRLSSTSRQSII